MNPPRRIALQTHHRVDDTRETVRKLLDAVQEAGGEILVRQDEADKHGLDGGKIVVDPAAEGVDAVVALGGDGTMLSALREFAGTGAPVFSFNFGAVGFLAVAYVAGWLSANPAHGILAGTDFWARLAVYMPETWGLGCLGLFLIGWELVRKGLRA